MYTPRYPVQLQKLKIKLIKYYNYIYIPPKYCIIGFVHKFNYFTKITIKGGMHVIYFI